MFLGGAVRSSTVATCNVEDQSDEAGARKAAASRGGASARAQQRESESTFLDLDPVHFSLATNCFFLLFNFWAAFHFRFRICLHGCMGFLAWLLRFLFQGNIFFILVNMDGRVFFHGRHFCFLSFFSVFFDQVAKFASFL
jgi:hypothetical protein